MKCRSLSDSRVAIAEDTEVAYPASAPFRPSACYPELEGKVPCGGEKNNVYPLVRKVFEELGLDAGQAGTAKWNPLGDFIEPGKRVLIKPNLVRHLHLRNGPYEAVVTHASLVRAVLDYVALALQGQGEIVVGDAPVQSADFGEILEKTGLQKVCDDVHEAWGIPIRLVDFRLRANKSEDNHGSRLGVPPTGDPSGYRAVDLGTHSLLAPIVEGFERFRVTCYDCSEMVKHHNRQINEYLIPQSVLDADVVVNMPKLKTHRKVGLTIGLKNLVGINGHKDWLPHHRCGSVDEGGDEYLYSSKLKKLQSTLQSTVNLSPQWTTPLGNLGIRVARRLSMMQANDPYEEGSWYGNDTLWRTVLDINRVLTYANRGGMMTQRVHRRCFTLVDGIVAGQGEGPMEPDRCDCRIIAGGFNQVAIDAVMATVAGFDYRKIPITCKGFFRGQWPLAEFSPEEIQVSSNSSRWSNLKVGGRCNSFYFLPPSGWKGHVEMERL